MGGGADGLRADVRLTVGPGPGRRPRIEEMVAPAPITWRQAPDALYMVGTAASPVSSDDVTVTVTVRAGARLSVRSTAATVVWTGAGSRHRIRLAVEEGAELDWCPEPLIVTAGADHLQDVSVVMAAGARLRWRDVTVLGRTGEAPGRLESRLRLTVAGRPVLHHALGVGAAHPGWDGPAVVGPARVVAQEVVAGDGAGDAAAAAGPGWSVTPLAGPGALATAVGAAVGSATAALAEARRHLPALRGPDRAGVAAVAGQRAPTCLAKSPSSS